MMGESTVVAPINEDKMEGVGGGALEVSVSFGRFEHDSLSWERWSSFSQNKYLEEVEKCSTPGSVAMKKAYFEAHYKKVAAKKALLMDQQAQEESDLLRSKQPNGGADSGSHTSNDQCFAEKVMEQTSLISERSSTSTSVDEPNGVADVELHTSSDQCFAEKVMEETSLIREGSSTSTSVDEPNGVADVELHTSNDQCFAEEVIEQTSLISEGSSTSTSVDEPNGVADVELHTSNDQCFAEKVMEQTSLISDGSSTSTSVGEPNGVADVELHTSYDQYSAEEIMEASSMISEGSSTGVDQQKADATIATECESSLVEEEKQLKSTPDIPCLRNPEEAVLVKEETPSNDAEDKAKFSQDFDKEIKDTPKLKKEIAKQDLSKKSKKTTAANKEKNVARVQKKPASPLPKSPQISTPGVSRPRLASTLMSAARPSTRKETNSFLSKSKNSSTGERRKVVPSSLHMSLISLDPRKSDSAPPATTRNSDLASPATTRKSLIMENMGDKDIVKRAFKTFQNDVNQLKSSSEQITSLPKQVPRKGTGLKVSSSVTPRKDKAGSHKAGGAEGRSGKTVLSSFSLRSDDKAETRKKFLKKVDEKSNAKDNTPIRSKSKEQKETEIKKLRQSLNFKATPLPSFYHGQQLSKSLLEKDGSKNDTHR